MRHGLQVTNQSLIKSINVSCDIFLRHLKGTGPTKYKIRIIVITLEIAPISVNVNGSTTKFGNIFDY